MAVFGNALLQLKKEIVNKYLFGDQKVEVRLSEIPEEALAVGDVSYATIRWLEKKSIRKEHI